MITPVLRQAAQETTRLSSALEKATGTTNKFGAASGMGKATAGFSSAAGAAAKLQTATDLAGRAQVGAERATVRTADARRREVAATSAATSGVRTYATAQTAVERSQRSVAASSAAATRSTTALAKQQRDASVAAHGLAAGIGAAAGSLAGGIIGGAAAGALTQLTTGLVSAKDAARDLSEAQQKSGAIFGDNAAVMQSWARGSVQAFGLSERAAMDAASRFGDMFTQIGFGGKQAVGMSQDVVQLAADLGALHNIGTEDVLERISAGFRGEYDSLQLLIPNISAARVEQQAMAETGAKAAAQLTAQQKAAAVLSIVHKDGAKSAGYFADNLGSAAVQEQVAAANAENLAAKVGSALLPAWTATLQVFNASTPALESAADGLSVVTGGVGDAVGAFLRLPAPVQAAVAGMAGFRLLQAPLAALGSTVSSRVVPAFDSLRVAAGYASQAAAKARTEAVAAGAAAGGMGARWAGASAGMGTFFGVARGGVGTMGVLKGAASGLLGVLGGPWGIALAAAAAAVGFFAQKSAEAKARQEELKATTDSMTQTLVASGGAWTTAASQQMVAQAQQKNLIQNYTQMGYSVKQVTTALTQEGATRDAIIGQIDAKIAATRAEMRQSMANQDGASQAAAEQLRYYQQQRQNLLDLIGVGSQATAAAKLQAAANDAVSDATDGAAKSQQDQNKALTEAVDAAKAAQDALMGLANTQVQGRTAQADYAAATDDLKKKMGELSGAVVKGGEDFDLSRERGRNAQAALLKYGEAGRDAAVASLDLGKSVDGANRQMGEARQNFIRSATSMGLNKEAAERLATELGLTTQAVRNHATELGKVPRNVTTTVRVNGLGEAENRLSGVMQQLYKMDGFTADTMVRVATQGPFGMLNAAASGRYANGAVVDYYANGGIRREKHVAQIAPAGAMRVWAEPETHGEAYIPLAASKRGRSTAILAEVARRFGLAVIQQAEGGMLNFAGGAVTQAGNAVAVKGVKASGLVIPVTAKVTKIVVPAKVGVPLQYTPGGPWDRSGRRPDMNTSLISKLFGDRYISKSELEDAAKKYYDARVRFDETISKAAGKAAASAESARKKLDAAQARVSAAEAALAKVNKRKGASAADKKAARDRLTAARSNLTTLQRQARTTGSGGGSVLGNGAALSQAPSAIAALIRKSAAKYKVDPDLIAAVIKQESGFKRTARSKVGAQGLMQLMPGTARSLGVRDPYNAAQNIDGGTKYLAQLIKQFSGDVRKALAAYNAGPTRAKSSKPLPKETQNYVKKVTASMDIAPVGGSGGAGMNFSAARSAGKAAGANIVAMNKVAVSATKAAVQSKATATDARAAAVLNALSMNNRGKYVWGGGHSSTYYKNSAALAADCSGFVGWAIGHAVNKNVTTDTATLWAGRASKLGYIKIDPKVAAKTAGALMGGKGHVVMSLGDGRVAESYSKGKPVRIRKLSSRDMKNAAWNTALGPMTPGTAAQVTSGKAGGTVGGSGGVDPKTMRDVTKEREAARKEYEAALKAYKTPAYVHLAQATKAANTYSATFLANIRKIRDRGYPSLAYRLLEMGDEDGAIMAASMVNAPAKVLRQQRDAFEQNAKLAEQQKALTEGLAATAGPPAYITAGKEAKTSNARWRAFLANVEKIKTRGFPTLAASILAMGLDEGYDVSVGAAKASDKDLRGMRLNVTSDVEALQKRQDDLSKTLMGPLWRQDMTSTAKATTTSAAFLANIKKIRDRGFPTLALRLMEMGEDDAGAMAAEAAKASAAELSGWDKTNNASKSITDQAQTLLDQLKGIGQVLNVTVGLGTGGDPVVTYSAPRPVDARPSTFAHVQQAPSVQGGGGPLLHVENMYAASPAQAATQLETRLGDAVAVSGIGRVAV